MENSKKILHYSIGAFIGLVLGFVIWHTPASSNTAMSNSQGVHMMPNGSMMDNADMDMASMMQSMNAGLQGKTGDEFDKAFISEMIIHHEGAVAMAKLALSNAKHQEIKILANAIISTQTIEIQKMKEWLKSWYN